MKFNFIDKKGLKLLALLDQNSRTPLSELAKKIRLSKQTTHYRLEQLKEKKILLNTYPVVAPQRIGLRQYKIYLKLKPINQFEEEKFAKNIKAISGVVWIASARGNWDFAISLFLKEIKEFTKSYEQILKIGAKIITEKNLLIVDNSILYTRNYLGLKKKSFNYHSVSQSINIDSTDNLLLKELSKNVRSSLLSISQRTGISRTTLVHHLKKLEKERVIIGYRSLFNLKKLGITLYKVIVKLNDFNDSIINSFEEFINNNLYGTQFIKLIGNNDLELEFEVPNEEIFHEILLELRKRFSKYMNGYGYLLINKEYDIRYVS